MNQDDDGAAPHPKAQPQAVAQALAQAQPQAQPQAHPEARPQARRQALWMLGVGAGAAAVGVGLALRRPPLQGAADAGTTATQGREPGAVSAASGAGSGVASGVASRPAASGPAAGAAEFWALSFPKPAGGALAMAGFRGRPLLLNFWATWCPPCLREMPVLDRFSRQFAANGWQVCGLAADQEKPVREFLGRNPVSYPIALAGFDGIALSQALGNSVGALPFTVAFDAAGGVTRHHLGEVTFEQLASWAGVLAPVR